ncbi:MAG: bifunctional phosphoribosylaminoimidazolecarboxamide formyltransferase/IMP cyclohydrolase [Planctomycetota bacterium]
MSGEIVIKRALISVFKKDGVLELGRALANAGVEIISTGGTAKLLEGEGIAVTPVSKITEFPEMMDGRVKTLHPRIHGGLLMRRDVDSHRKAAAANGITPIDLVVVNLYPFGEVIAKPDCKDEDAIEMIDIGGPSMVRSAAKNHDFVAVVTDPVDYASLIANAEKGQVTSTPAERRQWAAKAFQTTAAYDAAIASWMLRDAEELPQRLQFVFDQRQSLRYGENPHQRAALYTSDEPVQASVAWAHQHSGKALSFNNYLDAAAALEAVRGLEGFGCTVIKHKNPCGAASRDDSQVEAYQAAYAGDPQSAFGGIVAFNQPLTPEVARLMAVKEKFYEVVVAPRYEGDALEILQTGAKWGKNVRLLECDDLKPAFADRELELRWIRGGMLVQDPDLIGAVDFKVVSERQPDEAEMDDLRFAWELVRNVTSNAIVYAKDRTLVAAGAGQMSRVDSVELAGRKGGDRCQGAVMASDAFFPFPDGILAAKKAGIRAVVQPGGSIRDGKIIEACDAAGIAMVFTGRRHFRH